MKHQVCVVSGTRADYGLLRPLLIRLRDCPEIELTIAATGSHLSAAFGGTVDELTRDGFAYDSVPFPLDDDSKAGMARATGAALSAFADYFSARRPDLLVVLGDRYEIFAVAIAAHFSGIPIAHISGGDVTEGAVDDAIRHSVTKMSTLHFPGCEQSRRRIIQMGESPERVFNVGEPGVENCLNTPLLSVEELSESLQFDLTAGPYSVVTFHPVTLEDNTAERAAPRADRRHGRVPRHVLYRHTGQRGCRRAGHQRHLAGRGCQPEKLAGGAVPWDAALSLRPQGRGNGTG